MARDTMTSMRAHKHCHTTKALRESREHSAKGEANCKKQDAKSGGLQRYHLRKEDRIFDSVFVWRYRYIVLDTCLSTLVKETKYIYTHRLYMHSVYIYVFYRHMLAHAHIYLYLNICMYMPKISGQKYPMSSSFWRGEISGWGWSGKEENLTYILWSWWILSPMHILPFN